MITVLKYIILSILFISLLTMFCGCSQTMRTLFEFKYVTTKSKIINTANGKKLKNVKSEMVCKGDDGLGLMETAVNNALSKAKGATYLKDASFISKGDCVQVSGEAYK